MLALCDMFRLFGPARAGTDRDEAERWRGALEGTGERGLQLWADLAQHAIDRKVKAVWWLSHYGLLESESSCWSRMPSVWYEPAADMSRSGGVWGVQGAGTGGVGMDAPGAVCVLQRLLVRGRVPLMCARTNARAREREQDRESERESECVSACEGGGGVADRLDRHTLTPHLPR